jgi:hypothetical protein
LKADRELSNRTKVASERESRKELGGLFDEIREALSEWILPKKKKLSKKDLLRSSECSAHYSHVFHRQEITSSWLLQVLGRS